MSTPVRYFDLIREMKNAFNHRLRLVTYARQHGIKGAARVFHTSVPTVRKWLRRHQAQGLKGLEELARNRQDHGVYGLFIEG
jgi:transposase